MTPTNQRFPLLLAMLAAVGGCSSTEVLRDKTLTPVALVSCGLYDRELAIAELLEAAEGQQRKTLSCDRELIAFARARARDMAKRRYFSHLSPDLIGPNETLRRRGYALPPEYGAGTANNIEAIAAGLEFPQATWDAWLESPEHRALLLGEHEFYLAQTRFGVGYANDRRSPYVHYWVVVTAP